MTNPAPANFARILAIETATRQQALALVEGEELREHRVHRVRYNHGSSLLQNIDHLLSGQTIDLGDIDLFAVGLGPGSFTGLRVGLATAKALARATKRPIVGVSSLAALAYAPAMAHREATIAAAIDARRHEVYAGAYRWSDDGLISVFDDCAAAPQVWRDEIAENFEGPIIQVGDGVAAYPELSGWADDDSRVIALPIAVAPPSAVGVAFLGRQLALREGPADLISLEPNYIRPSDARLPERPPGPMPEMPVIDQTNSPE